jgi:tRNA-specific 2-thiouridylase
MARIIVGMSGGVDSSLAAALLVEAGHEVIGVTLRTAPWHAPDDPAARFGACCSPGTAASARSVARQLGIPYYLLNHEQEFADRVIADFTREYEAGRTPSPCVVCNREIKFGTLLDRARAWEAEYVATGHYARIRVDPTSGRHWLCEGRDRDKDQSYFLWPLTQAQLAHALFPLGDLTKAEVRAAARVRGLATAEAPESQELCFVSGDYREFVRERVPAAFRPGPILDLDGHPVGTHAGLAGFTIGQRRGLGGGGDAPRFVVRLDAERNAVIVGPAGALATTRFEAGRANVIRSERLDEPLTAEARIRHRAPRVAAEIRPLGGARLEVRFAQPQRAVTPGQSVVFYQDDVVVAGAIIEPPGA